MQVADDMYHISFFQPDGIFIKRLQLSNRLDIGFIGQYRFYAWIWRPEDKQQVMLDRENNIIKTFNGVAKGLFSVSAPDSSGRAVMFNYAPDEYAPSLLYAHSGNFTAIAISNTYEILILDNKGNISKKILRNIKPEKIGKKEKRIKPDITQEETPYPVDIFSLQGSFLGTARFMEKPIFISGENMYFINSDKEGNLYLVRKSYTF
jgi:hypothetical protein